MSRKTSRRPHPIAVPASSSQQLRAKAASHTKSGEHREAISILKRAVEMQPGSYELRSDLANAYYRVGMVSDALREFNELVERYPNRSDAASNLAGVLSAMGHQTLAFQVASRALALDPNNTLAMNNLAEILKNLGDWAGARDVYAAALTIDPASAKMRMQYGMTLVALGDWVAGWREFEARDRALGNVLFTERLSTPRWDGSTPLTGRSILVQHEQGLGDSIMCARFAQVLAEHGATVHLRCPPPLVPFLSHVPGVSTCTAVGTPMPAHDVHVPLMSLMACLQLTQTSLRGAAYLAPLGECPAHIAALLPRDGALTVSLTWSGNPLHINDSRRSIPGTQLAALLETPGVRFVAMQKAPAMASVLPAALCDRVVDVGVHCDSFNDSAHALSRVDLVVTVDTAVAHLAGSIGAPTLMLAAFTPDYRWELASDRTPWYDSMTILRQGDVQTWTDVLMQVQRRVIALRDRLA